MELIPKIGITGLPRVGKTEALIKIARRLEKEYTVGGMITKTIKEDGERAGFKVVDWRKKEEKIFAHTNLDSIHRLGKYNIDLKALEEVGVKAIEEAVEDELVDIIIIDEVGKMELISKKFRKAVKDALDSDKPVLLTLHKKSRDSLLQDIRNMDNVRILEITPINRNLLPYKIEKILKENL